MRIYFDSCVIIYLIERREPWNAAIRRELVRLSEPESRVVFTDLVRLECRVFPMAAGRLDLLADYDAFFAGEGITWQSLETDVFDLATEIRAINRLKTPDALHLAAAIRAGCSEFWTNDRRLELAAAGRLRLLAFGDSAPGRA